MGIPLQNKTLTKYLIYILILTIPLTHKEMFAVFDPDLVWSKFVLIALAGFGVVSVMRNWQKISKDPFFILFLLTLSFQILSIFQSKDIANSLRFIAFQSAIVFSYPVIKDFIKQDKLAFVKIIRLYLMASFGVFVFLGYQYYLQSKFGVAIGGVWPVPGFSARYAATFWDVNHFGIYLVSTFFLFVSYAFTLKHKNTAEWIIYLLGIIGVLIAFSLTKSRSSMIGFAVGLGVFTFGYFGLQKTLVQKAKKWKLWVFFSLLISVLPLSLLWFWAENIRKFFLYRAVSFFSHLFLLKVGILMGIRNGLTGVGINAFYANFKQSTWADAYYYIDAAALNVKLPLHNLWLETLVETGFLGLLVFVMVWVLVLGGLLTLAIKRKDFIALGLASGISAFLAGGMFYSYKSEFFWFYALIAASYVSVRYKGEYLSFHGKSAKDIYLLFFGKKILVKQLILNSFVLLVAILPLFFIFEPLTRFEVLFYLRSVGTSLSSFYRIQVLNLLYVLGNYSYVGRLLPVLLYGSLLAFAYAIVSLYKKRAYLYKVFVVAIGVISFIAVMCFRQSVYNKDLTFILELAKNRGLFDRSQVYVGDVVDADLLQFYCGSVARNGNKLKWTVCDIKGGKYPSNLTKITTKTIYLGRNNYVDMWQKSVVEYNPSLKFTRIDRGDFSVLIFEPKFRLVKN